jgi:hypothetical protein
MALVELNKDERRLLADLLEMDIKVNEEFYYNNMEEYKSAEDFILGNKLLNKLRLKG